MDETRRQPVENAAALGATNAPLERAWALAYLGALLRHQGECAAAEEALTEGLRLAVANGGHDHASVALNVLGQVYSLRGRAEAARAALECQ